MRSVSELGASARGLSYAAKPASLPRSGAFVSSRHFTAVRRGSVEQNPYQVLRLRRDASEADVKKAYKERALEWHPDRHAADRQGEARKRFAEATAAYEVLKDPAQRRSYNVDSASGLSGRPRQRIFRQESGVQGQRQRVMEQFMKHQQQMAMRQQRFETSLLRPGLEVRVRHTSTRIRRASRDSGLGSEEDDLRVRHAGRVGAIVSCARGDAHGKVQLLFDEPQGSTEVWYGAGAVWDPLALYVGLEVRLCAMASTIERASRQANLSGNDDARRTHCADKLGSLIEIHVDEAACKIRVPAPPGQDEELWFGIGAFEPILSQRVDPHWFDT